MCQLYDCYTYTVLVSLEDYGFCAKGEGGGLAASGALGPGGSLPVNTGGGQLSAYYMWGFTPLSEAVIQARNDGGARQSASTDVILVSGNGGILDHHATLILSPHARGSQAGIRIPGPDMPAARMPAAEAAGTAGTASTAGTARTASAAGTAGTASAESTAGTAAPAGTAGAAGTAGTARTASTAGGGPKAASAAAGREGQVTAAPAGVIRRDERSAPFFDAAAADRLLIRRCAKCGRWLAPEAGGCDGCDGEDPGWAAASGHGTLVSWAVLHPRASPPGQPARTVLALVELDEGPWLHTGLTSTSPAAIAALRAGQRVAASFVHPPEGESYPVFTPVPAADPSG
jgi:uncharacterized OB-fold protein